MTKIKELTQRAENWYCHQSQFVCVDTLARSQLRITQIKMRWKSPTAQCIPYISLCCYCAQLNCAHYKCIQIVLRESGERDLALVGHLS